MRVSLNWLNEYIKIENLDPQVVADALTAIGLEVEGVEPVSTITGEVVVGKILDAQKHPDADKLRLCKVDIGKGAPLEIVCGAQNANVGIIACVATIGSTLPGGIKIKKSKIRGVESQGMMLAEDELGISDYHEGIIELDRATPIGSSVADLFKLNDTVFTLNLTPNRADCLSYIGIARDLSAKLGIPLSIPEQSVKVSVDTSDDSVVRLEVENAEDCPRFCAVKVTDVSPVGSPSWMQKRLNAAGMRPIDLIVDVTNYVMLEYGQPIHAYDERFINDKKIGVRAAKAGENVKTLDGQTRKMEAGDLLICDGKGPVGIAGVMGGENSEVKDDTSSIIVEVANFNSIKIRKTSKRLGLHTEASHRFERGVDINIAATVCSRVADLLIKASQELKIKIPKVQGKLIDLYPKKITLARIALRPSRARQILGLSVLEEKTITDLLEGLQFKLIDKAEDRLLFEIPSWRRDITREIDLIEEVGRLNGFDKIPYELPIMEIGTLREAPFISFLEQARITVAQSGLSETISFPFVAPEDLNKFNLGKDHPWRNSVALVNPLAEESSLLQPSLIMNLVKAVNVNERHGQMSVKLFECGRGYTHGNFSKKDVHLTTRAQGETRPAEKSYLAGILGQPYREKSWQTPEIKAEFFHAKTIVNSWLKGFGLSDLNYLPIDKSKTPFLHPGASASVAYNDTEIGYLGALHPATAQSYELDPEFAPIVFEIDLETLYEIKSRPRGFDTAELKFPPVSRDLALVIDRSLSHGAIEKAVSSFPRKRNLKNFRLFDVYQGDKVPAGKKSLAYAFSFQSPKRTLNDQEVDGEITQLLEWLEKEVGAKLRGF